LLSTARREASPLEWGELSPDEAEYAVKILLEIVHFVYINPMERTSRRLKETRAKMPSGSPEPAEAETTSEEGQEG
jgi:hypothetical protein